MISLSERVPFMSDLILHHYKASPFAEKIRTLLGFKGLAWRSVDIPVIMPKPDYVLLTGGFRRTPSLQIGADIYCDTHAIALELERRFPEPSIFANAGKGLNITTAMWADRTVFLNAARYMIGTNADHLPPEFHADRAAMRGGEANIPMIKAMADPLLQQLRPQLACVDDMLSDGRDYLLGDRAGLADLSVYHCAWFVGNSPATRPTLEPFSHLTAWMARMAAFGHGTRSEMTSEAAIEVARAASPAAISASADPLDGGPALGSKVAVSSDDGVPPAVEGELVIATTEEIAVRRHDDAIGEVVVHFPRMGYLVKAL